MALGPKRNAPPETRGKTAEGIAPEFARYRRLKKTAGIPAWPAAKNPARDGTRSGPAPIPEIGRLPPDVPVPGNRLPCTRNSRTRTAHRVRQVAASIRRSGFTGPVLFAGQHHFCRDGDLLRPGPGELRDPGFHPDRCRDAGG